MSTPTVSMPRVRKNLLGSAEPQSKPKEVRDLLREDYFGTIMLRPRYQRHIKWRPDSMNDFIGTVMNHGLVPGVIMYKLHAEDKDEEYQGKYKYEVVDGQHRLYTLNAFRSGTQQKLPHIKKPFFVHWCHETTDENGNKHIQRVFYQETQAVVNWYRETYKDGGVPCFLTDEEKDAFDDFTIGITMIDTKLSMDQRREIFMSLQKGIPVRNSDYLKNMTSCKLIAYFEENNYESMMTDVFFEYCSKKAGNYWIQWATRCFLLFEKSKEERSESEPVETFLKYDSAIQKAIKNNNIELNPTAEQFSEFDDAFRSFIDFLRQQEEGTLFNPTQLFALFYHVGGSNHTYNTDILTTHMSIFSKEGQKKVNKCLWESKGEIEPRKRYFNKCLTQLEDMTAVAKPIDTRPISKKLRKQVFEKAIVAGKCDMCETEITMETFHAAHIVARSLGGETNLDNLIPTCRICNLKMGTQKPDVYKEEVLPYNTL